MLVKSKQVLIELSHKTYKLSLEALYGRPAKGVNIFSLLNERMIMSVLMDREIKLSLRDRKCLISKLGLTGKWKEEMLFLSCTLPIVRTLRFERGVSEYLSIVCNAKDDGGCEIIERGVVASESSVPVIEKDLVALDGNTGMGVYSIDMPVLGKTTYYRSFAKNKVGLSYGNIISITVET